MIRTRNSGSWFWIESLNCGCPTSMAWCSAWTTGHMTMTSVSTHMAAPPAAQNHSNIDDKLVLIDFHLSGSSCNSYCRSSYKSSPEAASLNISVFPGTSTQQKGTAPNYQVLPATSYWLTANSWQLAASSSELNAVKLQLQDVSSTELQQFHMGHWRLDELVSQSVRDSLSQSVSQQVSEPTSQ